MDWPSATESVFFFFQAEDGIRDYKVTGVQTCALPILAPVADADGRDDVHLRDTGHVVHQYPGAVRHEEMDGEPLPHRQPRRPRAVRVGDRKSTRLNSSHLVISYAVFCLKKTTRSPVDA